MFIILLFLSEIYNLSGIVCVEVLFCWFKEKKRKWLLDERKGFMRLWGYKKLVVLVIVFFWFSVVIFLVYCKNGFLIIFWVGCILFVVFCFSVFSSLVFFIIKGSWIILVCIVRLSSSIFYLFLDFGFWVLGNLLFYYIVFWILLVYFLIWEILRFIRFFFLDLFVINYVVFNLISFLFYLFLILIFW